MPTLPSPSLPSLEQELSSLDQKAFFFFFLTLQYILLFTYFELEPYLCLNNLVVFMFDWGQIYYLYSCRMSLTSH